MDYLRQIDPGNPYPISICLDKDEMLIGRYTIASLGNYSQVSRYHACLTKKNGSWYIKDLGSLNDLYVNFKKVGKITQRLELGDIIGFGTSALFENGGFSCVLKTRVKQELGEEYFVATPPRASTAVHINEKNCGETVQEVSPRALELKMEHSEPAPLRTTHANVLDFKRFSCDGFKDMLANCCGNVTKVPNPINRKCSSNNEVLSLEFPPKQSLTLPVAACSYREKNEHIPIKKAASAVANTSIVQCRINLIKCDSKHFKWPSYVKRFNVQQRLSQMRKQLQRKTSTVFSSDALENEESANNVRMDSLDSSTSYILYTSQKDTESTRSTTRTESGNISKEIKYLKVSENIKIKLKNNRILSSDASDDDTEAQGRYNVPSEVATESDDSLKSSSRSRIGYHTSHDRPENSKSSSRDCKRRWQLTSNSKVELPPKRLKQFCNDESDSSVSSNYEIRYPSSEVIKQIKRDASNSRISKSVRPSSTSRTTSNGNKKKTAGLTLLTDAKPIIRRPRRIRAREEWFQERYTTSREQQSDSFGVRHSKVQKIVQKSESGSIADTSNIKQGKIIKCSERHNIDVLDQVENLVMPGDRSQANNLNIKKCFQKDTELNKTCSDRFTESKTRRNIRSVPRRPSNFGSRMGFLVAMQEIGNKRPETKRGSTHNVTKSFESLPNPASQNMEFQTTSKELSSVCNTISKSSETSEGKEPDTKYVVKALNVKPTSRIPSERVNVAVAQSVSAIQDSNANSKIVSKLCSSNDLPDESYKTSITSTKRKVAVISPIKRNSVHGNRPNHTKISCLFDSSLFIEKIVKWNPKWLEEQRENDKPPPVIFQEGSTLPLSFETYENYVSSFYPMIVLDVWQSLYQKYKVIFLHENGNRNKFYYRLNSWENKSGMFELQCISLVSETASYHPAEGDVVLLNIQDIESHIHRCIFGYIHRRTGSESKFDKQKLSEWNDAKIPLEWFDKAMVCKFSLYIKKSRKLLQRGSVNFAYRVLNIKQELRLADSLRSFKVSPLQKDIVQLKPESFFLCDPDCSKSDVTPRQIIEKISGELKNKKSTVKIFVLNGPPGTGKTDVVVKVIEKLFNTPNVKILVCAPSNSAVDEIGCRLIDLNERCSWKANPIKFVRIGSVKQIHLKMQSYCLERKVSKLSKHHNREEKRRETEIKNLEDEINNVLFNKNDGLGGMNYRKIVDNDTLQVLMNRYKSLKDQKECGTQNNRLERMILKESHVILSTLSNFKQSSVADLFETTSVTSLTCIVDEATQCTELEIIQCLTSGVKKLILMGDCQHMPPPIKSKHAANYGYGRSMFERFCLFFKRKHQVVPFFTLKEQYRMRSEICNFPSKYFYNRELVTAKDTDDKYKHSLFRPYVVYDIIEEVRIESLDEPDRTDSHVLVYMCSQFLMRAPAISIGIIATSGEQLVEYASALKLSPHFKNVEVNLLEAYQGREKEIIIIPLMQRFLTTQSDESLACVRRLNVAFTRARQCLIALGHLSSLMHYQHWRALIDDAKYRNRYIGVASLKDIPFIFIKTITHA